VSLPSRLAPYAKRDSVILPGRACGLVPAYAFSPSLSLSLSLLFISSPSIAASSLYLPSLFPSSQ